jgi:hypothetical protein
MWHRSSGYTLYLPRNPWVLLLALAAAGLMATLVFAMVVTVAAMAGTALLLAGGAWAGWQLVRSIAAPRPRRARGRLVREARGLLEMAATPNPMEQYLIAVREFERISMAALELDPEQAGRRGTNRRAWELAEQAQALGDAVNEIERYLVRDPYAGGARTHVWELSLAVREVQAYTAALARTHRRPGLVELRGLVAHRATLTTRRTLLVDRLDSADVTRLASSSGSHEVGVRGRFDDYT